MNLQTTARDKQRAKDCEYAISALLAFARHKAKNLGHQPSEVAAAIFGKTTERQARSLLFDALTLSLGINSPNTTKILNSLRVIDRCHADDFESMEEFWRLIEDTARKMARECREYQGDSA